MQYKKQNKNDYKKGAREGYVCSPHLLFHPNNAVYKCIYNQLLIKVQNVIKAELECCFMVVLECCFMVVLCCGDRLCLCSFFLRCAGLFYYI